MKFDKSKVCVGLHEVKEGTKGWFADSVDDLDYKVTRNSVTRTSGCLAKMKGQRDCLYVDELNTVWRFFYPAPEKTVRLTTIEEVMKGKWIRSKGGLKQAQIIDISISQTTGVLYFNGIPASSIFEISVIDDTFGVLLFSLPDPCS